LDGNDRLRLIYNSGLETKTLNGYLSEIAKFVVREDLQRPRARHFLMLYLLNYFPRFMQWFAKSAHLCPIAREWATKKNIDLKEDSIDMTTAEGRVTVVKCVEWVSAGLPGYYERPGNHKWQRPAAIVSFYR
jgi:hypothetical protein